MLERVDPRPHSGITCVDEDCTRLAYREPHVKRVLTYYSRCVSVCAVVKEFLVSVQASVQPIPICARATLASTLTRA